MRGLELRKGTMDLVVNDLAPDIVYQLQQDRAAAGRRVAGRRLSIRRAQPARSDPAGRARAAGDRLRRSIARRSSTICGAASPTPAVGMLPPLSWAFDAGRLHVPARSGEGARAARRGRLSRIRTATGRAPRLRLSLKISNIEFNRLQSSVIQQNLRDVGIELDVRTYEFATLYADVLKGNFQMYTLQWIGGAVADPDILRRVFHSTQMPPRLQSRLLQRSAGRSRCSTRRRRRPTMHARRALFRRRPAHRRRGCAVHQPLVQDERRRRAALAGRHPPARRLADFMFLKDVSRAPSPARGELARSAGGARRARARWRRASHARRVAVRSGAAASARCRPSISSSTSIRARIGSPARLAAIAEEAWHERRAAARRHAAAADPRRAGRSDRAGERLRVRRCPTTPSSSTPSWPSGSEFIGRTDDWLRLVFTHEFTHIVHLDRSEGWARIVRDVFGRVPSRFRICFCRAGRSRGSPTYEESGAHRRRAAARRRLSRHRQRGGARARARAARSRQRRADRLAGRPRPVRLRRRLSRVPRRALRRREVRRAGRTPPRGAFRYSARASSRRSTDARSRICGATTSRAPSRQLRLRLPTGPERARLTHDGFTVAGPAVSLRSTCGTCPLEIVYTLATPHGFSVAEPLTLDGSAPTPDSPAATLGSTTAIGRETIYFDQEELQRNTGLYADLYALDRASGHVRAITLGRAAARSGSLAGRADDRRGRRTRPGQRDLVLVRLGADPQSPRGDRHAPRRGGDAVQRAALVARRPSRSPSSGIGSARRPRSSSSTSRRALSASWRPTRRRGG